MEEELITNGDVAKAVQFLRDYVKKHLDDEEYSGLIWSVCVVAVAAGQYLWMRDGWVEMVGDMWRARMQVVTARGWARAWKQAAKAHRMEGQVRTLCDALEVLERYARDCRMNFGKRQKVRGNAIHTAGEE